MAPTWLPLLILDLQLKQFTTVVIITVVNTILLLVGKALHTSIVGDFGRLTMLCRVIQEIQILELHQPRLPMLVVLEEDIVLLAHPQ